MDYRGSIEEEWEEEEVTMTVDYDYDHFPKALSDGFPFSGHCHCHKS